jgi:hypothetical protein
MDLHDWITQQVDCVHNTVGNQFTLKLGDKDLNSIVTETMRHDPQAGLQ